MKKKIMDNTLQKGMLIELHCIEKLIELGYFCSIPYGNSCKYDLIVDINNKLYRIQCKSSIWAKDTAEENVAFIMNTNHTTTNTTGIKRYTYNADQVDFFYTYFEGEHYLVPIQEVEGKTAFRFRYAKYVGNQKNNIHIAENYQLEKTLSKIKMEGEVVE